MKSKLLFTAILFMLIGLGSAKAQQRGRIKQGVQTGELTRSEARNLAFTQHSIHREMRSARADGVVTPGERRVIRHDKRQASRKIYRKKHNCRKRF